MTAELRGRIAGDPYARALGIELDLGKLEIGRRAWIERVRFEVELVRP